MDRYFSLLFENRYRTYVDASDYADASVTRNESKHKQTCAKNKRKRKKRK